MASPCEELIPGSSGQIGCERVTSGPQSRATRLPVPSNGEARGRPEAPDGAEGAQCLSARGAEPPAVHRRLQRLLEVLSNTELRRAEDLPDTFPAKDRPDRNDKLNYVG